MAKEYVPIFFEWLDVTQDLTAEEKGNLIDAVVSYASGREYEHLLSGAPCRIAFRFLKGQVDRNAAISDVRRQARQGKTQQATTNDNKQQQTTTNLPKEKEKEKEKEKDKDKERKRTHEAELTERFGKFWDAYPRKEAKQRAEQAFRKIAPDDVLLARMLDSIEKWKQSEQWTKDGKAFIPHPATWLNGRRWEDEVPKPAQGNRNPAAQFEQRDYSTAENDLSETLAALGY